MFHRDFLRLILKDEKKLMPIAEVTFVNVPMFNELSVVQMWPGLMKNKEFAQYFPDSMRKGSAPKRDYFFNILNSLQPDYVSKIVAHAHKQRN
jgi:hypothetical protein